MARLTSPTGATVTVPDDKVAGLLSRGFVAASEPKPAKKAAPRKADSK